MRVRNNRMSLKARLDQLEQQLPSGPAVIAYLAMPNGYDKDGPAFIGRGDGTIEFYRGQPLPRCLKLYGLDPCACLDGEDSHVNGGTIAKLLEAEQLGLLALTGWQLDDWPGTVEEIRRRHRSGTQK
jgi:hypothetical protein